MVKNDPVRLTLSTLFQSSKDNFLLTRLVSLSILIAKPSRISPAQGIAMLILLNLRSAALTISRDSFSSATSPQKVSKSVISFSCKISAVLRTASGSRSAKKSMAPFCPKWSARLAPIPLPAPVINTTDSLRFIKYLCL